MSSLSGPTTSCGGSCSWAVLQCAHRSSWDEKSSFTEWNKKSIRTSVADYADNWPDESESFVELISDIAKVIFLSGKIL